MVDDGTDRTAALVRTGPEAAGGELELLTVPHGGKGAAVRAGMLAGRGDLIVFSDADMATPPDEIEPMVEALATADAVYGTRIQADGSDMRQSQPAWRRVLGRIFHVLASVWVAAGPGHAVRLQGLPPRGRARCVRTPEDHQHRVRHRGDLPGPPARVLDHRLPVRWEDRRGSRMHPGVRLAIRVAWDLLRTPLLHRDVKRVARGATDQPAG